jgi:hypothetical protein
VIVGVAGLCVVGGALVSVAAPFTSLGSTPEPTPTPTLVSKYDLNGFATAPPKGPVVAPEMGSLVWVAPGTLVDPYSGFVPDSCPEGTTAGAVDPNGNESNCQPVAPPG